MQDAIKGYTLDILREQVRSILQSDIVGFREDDPDDYADDIRNIETRIAQLETTQTPCEVLMLLNTGGHARVVMVEAVMRALQPEMTREQFDKLYRGWPT